jgi:CheY-like chemotaxis protein
VNKILVIEDDQLLRENLCELLSAEGYEVDWAENGKVGFKKAKKILPDLIICDIMMPEMSGFELLEELQKDSDTETIPFIFLTAKVEMENLRRGMKLGADDYLFKPFDIGELLDAVQTRLKKKKANGKQLKEMQEQITMKLPHELRTPLVPILGYAEMIEEEDDIDQIKKMVKIIGTSGKILHGRIEKFLLYKDLVIVQHKKNFIKTDLRTQLTEDSVSKYISNIAAELKPIDRVKIGIEPDTVAISEFLLQRLVIELVENGLKFSDLKRSVFLQGYKSSEHYIIRVNDSGCGINENEIKSIAAFGKFRKERQCEPGLGLGLTIVQKITEMHGGYFTIKSELNKFTTCEAAILLD